MCVRAFRVERLSPRQTNKQTNKQAKQIIFYNDNKYITLIGKT